MIIAQITGHEIVVLTSVLHIGKVFIMFKKSCFAIVSGLLIVASAAVAICLAADEDQCAERGISVRNMALIDLWYRKNGGQCSTWYPRDPSYHLTIKPGDNIEIFLDSNCQQPYCTKSPAYEDYKSADTNGTCNVNILPFCKLSNSL